MNDQSNIAATSEPTTQIYQKNNPNRRLAQLIGHCDEPCRRHHRTRMPNLHVERKSDPPMSMHRQCSLRTFLMSKIVDHEEVRGQRRNSPTSRRREMRDVHTAVPISQQNNHPLPLLRAKMFKKLSARRHSPTLLYCIIYSGSYNLWDYHPNKKCSPNFHANYRSHVSSFCNPRAIIGWHRSSR